MLLVLSLQKCLSQRIILSLYVLQQIHLSLLGIITDFIFDFWINYASLFLCLGLKQSLNFLFKLSTMLVLSFHLH